jgi:hypothetical protein
MGIKSQINRFDFYKQERKVLQANNFASAVPFPMA